MSPVPLSHVKYISPYRLVARSLPFQGRERGSEPRRDAITQRFESATVYHLYSNFGGVGKLVTLVDCKSDAFGTVGSSPASSTNYSGVFYVT